MPEATAMTRRFPRRLETLPAMNAFAAEFFAAAGLPADGVWQVELVVEEIFTNMLKYGRGGGPEVELSLGGHGGTLRIGLADFGVEAFDLTQLPELDVEEHLARGRIGGLGLHLVRTMAEDIAYDHQDGTARITVILRLER